MNLTQAYEELSREYFKAILWLRLAEADEFNFFKTTVTGESREVYLIQIQHVDGPKYRRASTGADNAG